MFSRRILTTAVLIAATVPSVALAQPNSGGGPSGGDSDYCQTLKDRAQRYNDIAGDTRQPVRVRAFYKGQARVAIIKAREAGCAWASPPAIVAADRTGVQPASTRATSRSRSSFSRLNRRYRAFHQRMRRQGGSSSTSFRIAAGPTTTTPADAPRVVFVKATTTGNTKQDDYCSKAADMITDALDSGDDASHSGDQAGYEAWYDLADHMIDVSTANGCRFTAITHGSTPVTPQAQTSPTTRAPGPATRG
jgi:hypothetical protein